MARRQKIFCGRKIIIDLKNLETCFTPRLAYPPKEKKENNVWDMSDSIMYVYTVTKEMYWTFAHKFHK